MDDVTKELITENENSWFYFDSLFKTERDKIWWVERVIESNKKSCRMKEECSRCDFVRVHLKMNPNSKFNEWLFHKLSHCELIAPDKTGQLVLSIPPDWNGNDFELKDKVLNFAHSAWEQSVSNFHGTFNTSQTINTNYDGNWIKSSSYLSKPIRKISFSPFRLRDFE